MALQFSDSAKVLLDQQLVNLTDVRQELIETETRDSYYLLRLHNIDVTLTQPEAQTFITADQLTEIIQEIEALVAALREDGYDLHLHTVEEDVVDVLKRAERQRRVRNTVDHKALVRAARVLRAVRIAIERTSMDKDRTVERIAVERASMNEDRTVKRHKRTRLSVKVTTQRLRAMATWLDKHDPSAKTNEHRPPDWTDVQVASLVRFATELRTMREAFLVTNSTTRGLAPVLNQLGLLYETFKTEERVRRLRPAELRYAARQLRDTADMVEQLDTKGIIDDDDKLQRWIEFANEDLAAKMEREDLLSLPLRTVVDRFLLAWHAIVIELTSPEPWRPATDAPKPAWNEWWTIVWAVMVNVWRVFTQEDRLLYVGVGLVVAAFFVFFLTLTG